VEVIRPWLHVTFDLQWIDSGTPRIDRVPLDPTFAQTVVGERVQQRLIDSGALGFRLSDPDDAVLAGVRISVDF
jgi:hypothetical protein